MDVVRSYIGFGDFFCFVIRKTFSVLSHAEFWFFAV